MGLGDFFRRRREKESAIPPSSTDLSPSLPSFASSDAPVVGSQVGGGVPSVSIDLSGLDAIGGLAGLGAVIQQAAAQGNIEVTQESQTIDARGAEGLREEILGIMQQHGIDAESGAGQNVDASAYGDMQQQMLDALARHGLDIGGSGGAASVEIRQSDE